MTNSVLPTRPIENSDSHDRLEAIEGLLLEILKLLPSVEPAPQPTPMNPNARYRVYLINPEGGNEEFHEATSLEEAEFAAREWNRDPVNGLVPVVEMLGGAAQ